MSDGKPYGPERFKAIVRERYIISKFINTSYNDVGDMTPLEREYIIGFIAEEKKREEELIAEKSKKKGKRR